MFRRRAVENAARQTSQRLSQADIAPPLDIKASQTSVTRHSPAEVAAENEDHGLSVDSEDEDDDDDDLYVSSPELEVDDMPELKPLRAIEGTVKVSASRSLLERLGHLGKNQESVGGLKSIQDGLESSISQLFVKVRNYAKTKQDEGEDVSSWLWGAEVTNTGYDQDDDDQDTVAVVKTDIIVEAESPKNGHQVSCGYTVTSVYLPEQNSWSPTLRLLPEGQTGEWTGRKDVSSSEW